MLYNDFEIECKHHIIDLPNTYFDVSHAFDYPYDNELAIGICIYTNPKDFQRGNHWVKTGIFSALRHLWATDAIECKVPIYFFIGSQYIDQMNNLLDRYNHPQHLRIPAVQFGKNTKHSAIFRSELDKYQRLLVFDADMMAIRSKNKSALYSEIIQEWIPNEQRFFLPYSNARAYTQLPVQYRLDDISTHLGSEDEFWRGISKLQDKYSMEGLRTVLQDPNVESSSVGGWCIGFSKALRSDIEFHKNHAYLNHYISGSDGTLFDIYFELFDETICKKQVPIYWEYPENPTESRLGHFGTNVNYDWQQDWKESNSQLMKWVTSCQ